MITIKTLFRDLIATDKRIVLFGAGIRATSICRKFEPFDFIERIDCLVDNDSRKQGQKFLYGTTNKAIISLEDCLRQKRDTAFLVCVTQNWDEVYFQIKRCALENDVIDIYFYPMLDYSPYPYELPKPKDRSDKIPKKLHYCWFGGKPLPPNLQENIDYWHELLPDWEIIRWDESNYDINKNDYLRKAQKLDSFKFLKISNYARHDVVYLNGGIYLDTDVSLLRPINDWLLNEVFFCFEDYGRINSGSGFGAAKGNPIIKEMLEEYIKNVPSELCFVIETNVLKRHGLVSDNTFQRIDGITIYPSDVVAFGQQETPIVTQNTYARHWNSSLTLFSAAYYMPLYQNVMNDVNGEMGEQL